MEYNEKLKEIQKIFHGDFICEKYQKPLTSCPPPPVNKSRKGYMGIIAAAVALLAIVGIFLFVGCSSSSSNTINGHEYVDLGLPSGVKWATCNVGASSPSDYGDYFAWGETTTKTEYTEENSKTYNKKLGDISGNSQYDAARFNWGGSWRLPSKAELEELKDKCTWTWTSQGGHNGYKVTGPNGNSIFLPAAGRRGGPSLYFAGAYGGYRSSTSDESDTEGACGLIFGSDSHDVYLSGRSDGISVRPVSDGATVSQSNGSVSSPSVSSSSNTINGHEYVDLGLPSGLKWATCNVGASSPSDYGDYFAWGETKTKTEYTVKNSKTWEKSLGDISGNPQYDAARANWGGSWRLPLKRELEELEDKCTWTWTTQRGHNGYKVTGPNGNSIFLPAASYRNEWFLFAGDGGSYWSSTPYESDAWHAYDLSFDSSGHYMYWGYRYYGLSVRPVSDGATVSQPNGSVSNPSVSSSSNTINGHEYVDLGLPSGLKWATCNVGAFSPSDDGSYFAWGETTTKTEYTEENSKTYNKSLGDISGNPQYDAARANWGGSWRLPSKAELAELEDKCTWTWTTQGGHNGYKVTGPNGNSIFLPAAGWRYGSSFYFAGDFGYYWSSTPYESYTRSAYDLYFGSSGHSMLWNNRSSGLSVRPVTE